MAQLLPDHKSYGYMQDDRASALSDCQAHIFKIVGEEEVTAANMGGLELNSDRSNQTALTSYSLDFVFKFCSIIVKEVIFSMGNKHKSL